MSETMSLGGIKSTHSQLANGVHVLKQKQTTLADIKVAAYCRVSTDMEIQQKSLNTQMAAYEKVIAERPGWVLAGIYADRGISGTSVKHREEFKRMIEDAKAGKIQYILAKSISRFARNTVDTLAYVRELKSYGVSVFFEKEKLDTGNAVSEFLLSIFAAAAQEEIISLSNNMKVGKRMRYAAGVTQWTRIYGFRKAEDGAWVPDPEEAEVVRRIFFEYVSGRSLPEICKGLMADGIPSSGGKEVWAPKSMADILHNEKYMGDLRMQKSYISDPIQHVKVNNRDARLKQFYKENHHAAIVDRRTYAMAQTISIMKDNHRGTTQYPYYGFLQCPICGKNMPRNNHTFAWTCGGKPSKKGELRKHRTTCPPYYILENYIDEAFWTALHDIDENELTSIADGTEAEKATAAKMILSLKNEALKKTRATGKAITEEMVYTAGLDHAVEYKTLCDTVQSISFPQWNVMKIDWICGLTTSTGISYRKAADQPYPTITKEEIEHTTKYKGIITMNTYVINGVPLIKGCPDRQIEGIRTAQEAVLNTIIQEPFSYEPSVPRVFGVRSMKISKESTGDRKEGNVKSGITTSGRKEGATENKTNNGRDNK